MAGTETQNTNELLQIRRDKLAELRAAGNDPFIITKYDVTTTLKAWKDKPFPLPGG